MIVEKEIVCGVCPSSCNVIGCFDNEKLINVKKSKKADDNICVKGIYSSDIIYSKDRIKTPLIRIGEKGEGKFREASWDEALEYAAKGFVDIKEKYGANSLISHFGRGAFDSVTDLFATNTAPYKKRFPSFFEPFGSVNHATVASLCYVAFGVFAPVSTMGIYGENIIPDIENAKNIIVWGTNPFNNSPPRNGKRLLEAKKRGASIVVIDHHENEVSNIADKSILIRSGTDGLFILGLIKYVLENKLYNENFVENYTYGFDELYKYIGTIDYSYIEKTTGVKFNNLEEIALLLSSTNPTTLLTYTGLEYSNSGVQSIRGLYSLFALTGNLDTLGGLYLKPNNPIIKVEKNESNFNRRLGSDIYPLFDSLLKQSQFMEFPNAVLNSKPYKIAGLLNVGAVISINYPNALLFQEALRNLDFLVVVDRFKTRDTDFADVVFPATTHYEDYRFKLSPNKINIIDQYIPNVGDSKSNIFILHELAKQLGYGEIYPKNNEELINMAFENNPEILKSLKENKEYIFNTDEKIYNKFEKGLLRNDGKSGFPTKTGKFEFFSTLLDEFNYEPLPKYIEAIEGSIYNFDDLKKYPLILNTGARIKNTFRSQHLNIKPLVRYQPKPLVKINTEDAKKRNISTGDKVRITSKRGSIDFYANVTSGILKGEVEVNVGGGSKNQDDFWKDSNTNILTDNNNVDKITGFPCFKTLLCNIEKID